MAKPNLGTKRVCVACGAHFYDLGKTPAICPKCNTEQPPDQPRLHRTAPPAAPETQHAAKPEAETAEAALDLDEAPEGGDEDVIEDTSDLEDEPDGISNTIEVGSGEEHDG